MKVPSDEGGQEKRSWQPTVRLPFFLSLMLFCLSLIMFYYNSRVSFCALYLSKLFVNECHSFCTSPCFLSGFFTIPLQKSHHLLGLCMRWWRDMQACVHATRCMHLCTRSRLTQLLLIIDVPDVWIYYGPIYTF